MNKKTDKKLSLQELIQLKEKQKQEKTDKKNPFLKKPTNKTFKNQLFDQSSLLQPKSMIQLVQNNPVDQLNLNSSAQINSLNFNSIMQSSLGSNTQQTISKNTIEEMNQNLIQSLNSIVQNQTRIQSGIQRQEYLNFGQNQSNSQNQQSSLSILKHNYSNNNSNFLPNIQNRIKSPKKKKEYQGYEKKKNYSQAVYNLPDFNNNIKIDFPKNSKSIGFIKNHDSKTRNSVLSIGNSIDKINKSVQKYNDLKQSQADTLMNSSQNLKDLLQKKKRKITITQLLDQSKTIDNYTQMDLSKIADADDSKIENYLSPNVSNIMTLIKNNEDSVNFSIENQIEDQSKNNFSNSKINFLKQIKQKSPNQKIRDNSNESQQNQKKKKPHKKSAQKDKLLDQIEKIHKVSYHNNQQTEQNLQHIDIEDQLPNNDESAHFDKQFINEIFLGQKAKKLLHNHNQTLSQNVDQIQTWEQAIAYFGQYGDTAPVKFFKCILDLEQQKKEFDPYDIQIISEQKAAIIPYYYQISATGISLIFNSASKYDYEVPQVEVYQLSRWINESKHFKLIKEIPFFKQYCLSLYFLFRKIIQNMVQQLFKINIFQNKIQIGKIIIFKKKKSVLLRKSYINFLIFTQNQCYNFFKHHDQEISQEQKQTNNSIEYFIHSNKKNRSSTQQYYNTIIQEIAQNFYILVENITKNKYELEKEHRYLLNLINDKTKSIKSINEKKIFNKQLINDLIYDQTRFDVLIRAVDYLILQNLIKSSLGYIQNLYDLIFKNQGHQHQGYFKIFIQFDQNMNIKFQPSQLQIINALHDVISEFISIIGNTNKVSSIIEGYKVINLKIDINTLIKESLYIKNMHEKVDYYLSEDYKRSEIETSIRLSKVKLIQQDSNQWDDPIFIEQLQKKSFTVDELKHELHKLKMNTKETQDNLVEVTINTLYLNGNKIRSKLINYINNKQSFYKDYLYTFLRNLTQLTFDKQQKNIEILLKKPTELMQFSSYIQNVYSIESSQDETDHDKLLIEQAQQLLRKYDASMIKQIDASQLLQIQINQNDVKNHLNNSKILISQKKIDNQIVYDKYMNILDRDINNIQNLFQTKELKQEQEITVMTLALKDIHIVKNQLNSINQAIQKQVQQQENLKNYQLQMGYQFQESEILTEIEQDFQDKKQLWTYIENFEHQKHEWLNRDIRSINIKDIEQSIKLYQKFNGQLRYKTSKLGKVDNLLNFFMNEVEVISNYLPIYNILGNQDLKQRHLKQIHEVLENNVTVKQELSFNEILKLDIFNKIDQLEEISSKASGEALIEQQLENIQKIWQNLQFNINPYQDSKQYYRMSGVDEIYTYIDDHILSLQTMLGNKFVVQIKDQVEFWEKKIQMIREILDEWLLFQRYWMSLENIFNAQDIQKQLSKETTRFFQTDRFWRELMMKTKKMPTVQTNCNSEELLQKLQFNNQNLEEIQKSLEQYLDMKRLAFTRFYFLSNDDLLQILSQSKNPELIQPNISKCFDNMRKVDLEKVTETQYTFSSMIGLEPEKMPEKVQFLNIITYYIGQKVEFLFQSIQQEMINSLRTISSNLITQNLKIDMNDLEQKQQFWMGEYPQQCLILCEQIKWQQLVVDSIVNNTLNKSVQTLRNIVKKLIEIIITDLSIYKRTIICNLLIIIVHLRDTIELLIKNEVNNTDDFLWKKQLKFYWDSKNQEAYIQQINNQFKYSYEFLGNATRLVLTPLTDKCFLTMTNALKIYNGGSVIGPAGTGKTETVKELAKFLAIQCVVFNCSENVDIKTLIRFFNGLIQCGSWACYDEFNRIGADVLSVVAQQLKNIWENVKQKSIKFIFEGANIILDQRFGIFITSNPNYKGRTVLPDNLKSIFRQICMIVPDQEIIAEIIFLSDGFQNAKLLGKKIVYLFKLANEQLSKQNHYDFGLRALKAVLVFASFIRRNNPNFSEIKILIKAVEISNQPKFLAKDLELFIKIIKDLFPQDDIQQEEQLNVKKAIDEVLSNLNYDKKESQLLKILQLYETVQQRHGIIIIGQSQSAKSTVINILKDALMLLNSRSFSEGIYEQIDIKLVNPKSVKINNLFGYTNTLTNEWHDGIIAQIIRNAVEIENPNHSIWLHFDGYNKQNLYFLNLFLKFFQYFLRPADTLWIENLNTALDDNKMLCLSNGQRIKLPQSFIMLIEVLSLQNVTPATVSRCGIIYFDENQLTWSNLINNWIVKFKKFVWSQEPDSKPSNFDTLNTVINFLKSQILDSFEEILNQLKNKMAKILNLNNITILTNFFRLFESSYLNFYNFMQSMDKIGKLQTKEIEIYFQMITCFCIIWSLGQVYQDSQVSKSINKLSQIIRQKLCKIFITFPMEGEIYDYYIDYKIKRFKLWTEFIKPYTFNPDQKYFDIVISSKQTVTYNILINQLEKHGQNICIIGDSGSGKSNIINDNLASKDQNIYKIVNVYFSGQTSIQNLYDKFQDKENFLKIKKNTIGIAIGKKILCFIEDLNMPNDNKLGSIPALEFLRQVIELGFYDIKKLNLITIQNCQFISTINPNRSRIMNFCEKLLKQFVILYLREMKSQTLQNIFQSIIGGFLSQVQTIGETQKIAQSLVEMSIIILTQIQINLLPTPQKCTYNFGVRDLSKVFQGMMQLRPQNIISTTVLIEVWIHEMIRVFYDRLMDHQDRDYFNQLISKAILEKVYKEYNKKTLHDYQFTFLNNNKVYYKVNDQTEIIKFLQAQISKTQQRKYCVDWFQIFIKGLGGSGRQTISKLSSFLCNFQTYQLENQKISKEQLWKDEIKKILKQAGSKLIQSSFIFSDHQIIKESYMEDINNILSSGDLNNLLNIEDQEEIIQELKQLAKENGLYENRDQMLKLFNYQIRSNLHIILQFSPLGDILRKTSVKFPSVFNICTIIYVDKWQNESLYQVASKEISQYENLGLAQYKMSIARIMVDIHQYANVQNDYFFQETKRVIFITPSNFLDLINNYVNMLKIKQNILPLQMRKYNLGLDTINQTQTVVKQMQISINQFQPALKLQKEQNLILVAELNESTKKSQLASEIIQNEQKEAQIQRDEVNQLKINCQQEYEAALPILKAAQEAVLKIDKSQLNILKSYINPPHLVVMVLKATCLLYGYEETWENAKRYLLGDIRFLEKLIEYDVSTASESKFIKLREKYFKSEEFTKELIEKQSQAAGTIYQWVIAIDQYFKSRKHVAPIEKKLNEAQQLLYQNEQNLAEKNKNLQQIQQKTAELENKLLESENLSRVLEQKLQDAKIQLERAEKLLSALMNESQRWSESYSQFQTQHNDLTGNILLCAAFVSYTSAFSQSYRSLLTKKWYSIINERNIPCSSKFSFEQILSSQIEIQNWMTFDLPADKHSIENAIIINNNTKYSLIIDPENQANNWIKRQYTAAGNLQLSQLYNQKFHKHLEFSIQFGLALLIEDVELQLDSILDNVLQKITTKRGNQNFIKIGDNEFPMHLDFKIFLTSKIQNPKFMPEISTKVTIINFMITKQGLEEQLLIEIVKFERIDLETKRQELIVQQLNDKKQLQDLEDKILHQIGDVQDRILENDIVLNSLEYSSKLTSEINEKLKNSIITSEQINQARDQFRGVGKRAMIIYFTIKSLTQINHMYQWSLTSFIRFYKSRLQASEKSAFQAQRINYVIDDITRNSYESISKSIFSKNRLIYSFLLFCNIKIDEGLIQEKEFKFLILDQIQDEEYLKGKKPDYIENDQWVLIEKMCSLGQQFSNVMQSFLISDDIWKQFLVENDPVNLVYPDELVTLNHFQKLLIAKILRNDLFNSLLINYIKDNFGEHFLKNFPINLQDVLDKEIPQTPLLLILQQGSDLQQTLSTLQQDETKIIFNSIQTISLGQGQGDKAINLIDQGKKIGNIVILENCHLSVNWLDTLAKHIDSYSEQSINFKYRLCLTTMETVNFPEKILQQSSKLTIENPVGFKAKIQNLYEDLEDIEFYNQNIKIQKLIFSLMFYHSLINQRKNFGSIGWNLSYDWMNADFMTCSQQIITLSQNNKISYTALQFLIAEINYGGKVVDDKDLRLLKSMIQDFIQPNIFNIDFDIIEGSNLKLPNEFEQEKLQEFIFQLQDDDQPQNFGLNQNCFISKNLQNFQLIVNDLQKIYSNSSASKNDDNQEFIILKLISQFQQVTQIKFNQNPNISLSPLEIFRNQEIDKYNILITTINDSLNNLKLAIKGLIVMNTELDSTLNSLQFGTIPRSWLKRAYICNKPLQSWIENFKLRYEFIKYWSLRQKLKDYILKAFYFPQGFFTSLKQIHSRQKLIPIDNIIFQSSIMPLNHQSQTTSDGAYLKDFILEGCDVDFQTGFLIENTKRDIFVRIPLIYLQTISSEENKTTDQIYDCPIYSSQDRNDLRNTDPRSSNFITYFGLKTLLSSKTCILRGIALVTQTNS